MSRTSSSDYFSGLRDSLTSLVIDVVRARSIDVETVNDDRPMRDNVDVLTGQPGDPYAISPGGLTVPAWLLIGAAVIGGAFFIAKR